jgi:hypothetical protein
MGGNMYRWFSWFESAIYYEKEVSALKMVLECFLKEKANTDEGAEQEDERVPIPVSGACSKNTAQVELNLLKKRQGSWRTAIDCITEDNKWATRALQKAVSPVWTANTARVTNVLNADDAFNYECLQAQGHWQSEIKNIIDRTLKDKDTLQYLEVWAPATDEQTHRADDFVDLVFWLLRVRTTSLCHHTEFPRSLAALGTCEVDQAQKHHEQFLAEFSILLDMESLHKNGHLTKHNPLEKVVWRLNSWVRYVLCLIEKGEDAPVQIELRKMFRGFGDEKLIEDIHQHLRDMDNMQRQFKRSSVERFGAMLKSKVLEHRGYDTVKVGLQETAHAPGVKPNEQRQMEAKLANTLRVDKA